MALLQFPGSRLQTVSAVGVVGGVLEVGDRSKRLTSAAHFGGGTDPHSVVLHCSESLKRVKERPKFLVQAVFGVQEVENEGSGNFESRPRQDSGRGGRGSWNERGGRGRGRSSRGGGRGGRGRGQGSEFSSRERSGADAERGRGNPYRSTFHDDDDSHRASSSSSEREGYGFRGENKSGYGGRNESRREGRGSSINGGGYARRNGSTRGGYVGQDSYARGSYGRGVDGRIEQSSGRFSTRGEGLHRSDDRDYENARYEHQQESRGRGNASGRTVSGGEFASQDGNFRVNLPERSDASESRPGSSDRGKYAERSGRGETKEPWVSFEERNSKAWKAKGSQTTFQTITPRQATSQFVSDRTVYKAPWEQGTSDSEPRPRSFGERDFTQRNPLIERLQSLPAVSDKSDGNIDSRRDDDDAQATRFVRGGEKSAMARIVEKLSRIPSPRKAYDPRNKGGRSFDGSESTIFIPKAAEPLFPMVQKGWSTPDHPVPTPAQAPRKNRPDTRFPWEREEEEMLKNAGAFSEKQKRVKPPSLAELTIPEDELKRLRSLGILARHRIKIGRAGVTHGIVEAIHNEWRDNEVVRVKAEGPPAMNMKRTHQELEERTGGLVIWRAGGACLLYRGKDYVPPPLRGLLGMESAEENQNTEEVEPVDGATDESEDESDEEGDEGGEDTNKESMVVVPKVPKSVYDPEMERELEEILSALGPRYEDWAGGKPVPVDADQLIDPDIKFKKPYRLLPYGVKPVLSNKEMTDLRRLARPIPPHFVLGRNRGLDGLAAAIVKLWEKSEIAKVAVKRGVQNTNHERMGEELKRLTGGVLLARDKFFIVLYRGKDFLPPSVAAALAERQAMTQALQEEEEKVRLLPRSTTDPDTSETLTDAVAVAGTLSETLEARANWEIRKNSEEERINRANARRKAKLDMTRRIERKLAITMAKKQKAELELEKVEKRLRPAGPPLDRELITEEEMHMYLKLGLKMKAFLLLGRRGVFDGTIENMHLHWKHRELVKIIYKARNKIDLEQTAKMLEYESGGILVGTVPTSKGQAIIVYRGKNYSRPPELRPKSLLTKRQALKRSIELQRQEALERHMLALEKEIQFMQADLTKLGGDDEEGTDTVATTSSDFDEDDTDISFTGVKTEDLTEDTSVGYLSKRGKLDPIFRADPLSRREKLILRRTALKTRKAAHFNVGASNVVAGLARAIRIHFQKHALVKVGVKGRARGTPVEEIIRQLEDATGGTLVSQEASKIILYRGWPDGEERPKESLGYEEDDLTPELRDAMITEEGMDDDLLFGDEGNDSEWNGDDEDDDMKTTGNLDLEDDSDWDEDEDVEDDEDGEDVISRWQEDGSVGGPDEAVAEVASADSERGNFEYEDDTDDDVDFEWNEVEDGGSSEDDEGSHISANVSQSRVEN